MSGNYRLSWHQRMGRRLTRASGAPHVASLAPLWWLGAGNLLAALAALLAGMLPLTVVFAAAAWGCHACIRRIAAKLSLGM